MVAIRRPKGNRHRTEREAKAQKTMELAGRNIVVVGLARTGVAVTRFLVDHGARVTVTDQSREHLLGPAVSEVRNMGAALELGTHRMPL